MRLSKALNEKLVDVRLRDKFLNEGRLSKEEYETYINSLPDDEGKFHKGDEEAE